MIPVQKAIRARVPLMPATRIVGADTWTVVASIALLVLVSDSGQAEGFPRSVEPADTTTERPPAAESLPSRTKPIEAAPQFNRDIRPILSNNCFACHGPEDEHRQAGLRFDRQESVFGNAESGERPVVPGKPDQSEVMVRIKSDDSELRMPPPDSNKQLTPREVQLIQRWIEAGAVWQGHWSFIPPHRPKLPEADFKDWPRNSIDSFVVNRLEKEGLRPSPEADKVTLIRRVSLDLTGLPPTPAEVDAFLYDNSPNAYEKFVEGLLRSPQYGEHMARFWLDAARYGDTHGLHLDNYREIWPYRDWVISAFNRNLPYDQFIIQQIAGDLVPEATLDQKVATGFNRCHVTTNEGGSIKEEVYVRNVVDRVVTIGTVFMGMTFECTRCHDHKFDPYTMNDFYAMFAFFNSLDGSPLDGNRKDPAPVLRVPTDEQRRQIADFDRRIASMETRLRDPWPKIDQLQTAWEAELIAANSTSSVAGLEPAANNSVTVTLGDWFTVGPFAENRRYLIRRSHGPEGKPVQLDQEFRLTTGELVKWVRRADWRDGRPHQDLPGQTAANFLYRTITTRKARKIMVSLGSDDAVKVFLNGKLVLTNDVSRSVAPDQESLELSLKEGQNHLLIKIMNYGGACGFYFALKSEQATVPPKVLDLVRIDRQQRLEPQRQELREFFRNKVGNHAVLEQARAELARLRGARSDVDRQVSTSMVWREAKEARPAYYLTRGEYDRRGDVVSRRTPAALPPMKAGLPLNRLGFAKWLVDPDHPLTARVAVNRLWLQVFGTGIVETAEDFGSQGEPPTHPDLLDWLAVQFVADGWDVRAFMKRIVMSATYRQSSRIKSGAYQRDPANRLLSRSTRVRLDAEMLRDQALAIGGLLVQKTGGPSVKPPQPDGLWFAVGYSGSDTVRFAADKGHQKVHRRTLYTFIKRTAPPPQMSTFDGPSRESCVMRRARTNTPLQALLLFNDPQFVEAARALAERAMRESSNSVASRAAYMFRLCTCRQPTREELIDLVAGFKADLITYKSNVAAAQKLIGVGELPTDNKLDASELAAWTMVANMLLNLDEVINKN